MACFWDSLETVNYCMLYVPLRHGCFLVALFGCVYGFIGFSYLLSITALHADDWKELLSEDFDYKSQIVIFVLMTIVLLASIVLLIGTILENETCVIVYLWLVFFTLLVTWGLIIAAFFYCGIANKNCFYKKGFTPVFLRHMYIGIGFTLFWGYMLLVANSYRLEI